MQKKNYANLAETIFEILDRSQIVCNVIKMKKKDLCTRLTDSGWGAYAPEISEYLLNSTWGKETQVKKNKKMSILKKISPAPCILVSKSCFLFCFRNICSKSCIRPCHSLYICAGYSKHGGGRSWCLYTWYFAFVKKIFFIILFRILVKTFMSLRVELLLKKRLFLMIKLV